MTDSAALITQMLYWKKEATHRNPFNKVPQHIVSKVLDDNWNFFQKVVVFLYNEGNGWRGHQELSKVEKKFYTLTHMWFTLCRDLLKSTELNL